MQNQDDYGEPDEGEAPDPRDLAVPFERRYDDAVQIVVHRRRQYQEAKKEAKEAKDALDIAIEDLQQLRRKVDTSGKPKQRALPLQRIR